MFSSSKYNSFFALILILPIFFLISCGIEKSEYGKKSDYQKLGYDCPKTTDLTTPTGSSEIPGDNSTYNHVATTVSVTFSEAMVVSSIITNTSDTTCSGSLQLSSDNFSTCIKMSAAPVASNDNKTFTVTPASSLSPDTTFKRRLTSPIADTSCNFLASDNTSIVGFTTSPSGSGTIDGSVQSDNGSALSGVNVAFNILANSSDSVGTAEDDTTSVDNGTFSQSSLDLGIHKLTYTKTDYLSATLTDTLETDGETLTVDTIRLLSDNCTAGTMSGTVTDAQTGSGLQGVRVMYQPGLNQTDYFSFYLAQPSMYDTGGQVHTDANGDWSISNVPAGWYSMYTTGIIGYYVDFFNAYSCGSQPNQDNAMSALLEPGQMRIMLSWPRTRPQTAVDLDSHLFIPYTGCDIDTDGASDKDDKCHLHYGAIQSTAVDLGRVTTTLYHIYDGDNNDYVSLDRDHTIGATGITDPPPGYETITISKVRSGTYSFSVHNYTDKFGNTDARKTNFKKSRARVRVYYNDGTITHRRRFGVPNDNGTLWSVFTFNKDSSAGRGSGFTRTKKMSYKTSGGAVY